MSPSRPPTRDRAPNCTHLQLTRLFDVFGCNQCSICHRRPQLGWLYRCTQDFDGFLPASDFYNVEDHQRFDQDAQLFTLSVAVTEAAANGAYTDRELDVLWKQKIEVRRTIRQARPSTSSSASTASSSQYSLPASTTTSTVQSSDSDPDTELSQLSDSLQPCRGPLEPIREVHDDLENDRQLLPFVKPTMSTPCNFKICQTCRPIYQQRAWQSIDAVLKGPFRPPPKHEMANRRISDVNVVRNIGLHSCISTTHDRGLLNNATDPSKRNSRTQFQDIVQQLLKDQERPSDEYGADKEQQRLGLKRVPAAQSLFDPNTKDNSDDAPSEEASRTSPSFLTPLYHRHGSERLTSIQPALQKAKSECAESRSSAEPPSSKDNQPCPRVTLKIDTAKANEDRENIHPAQKTPTESIKESLCRLGGLRKTSARFVVD